MNERRKKKTLIQSHVTRISILTHYSPSTFMFILMSIAIDDHKT